MTSRTRRNLIIILLSSLICVGLFQFAKMFAPGSYPYVEKYDLAYSEEQIKQAIDEFKNANPEFKVSKVTIGNKGSFDLVDHQSKNPSYWYNVYFYLPNENCVLFTWTRPKSNDETTFAFVAVNESLEIGNWKEINNDLSSDDSKKFKNEFETRILNKIKSILETQVK